MNVNDFARLLAVEVGVMPRMILRLAKARWLPFKIDLSDQVTVNEGFQAVIDCRKRNRGAGFFDACIDQVCGRMIIRCQNDRKDLLPLSGRAQSFPFQRTFQLFFCMCFKLHGNIPDVTAVTIEN